jgi:hypothetical protein
MFTRNRVFAAATVVGALAIAAPLASASAAPMPGVPARVATSAVFPGNPWPHGSGHGHGFHHGRGYGHRPGGWMPRTPIS